MEVDPFQAHGHGPRQVPGGPQRRREGVADAGHAAAGDVVGLIETEGRFARPRDRRIAPERGFLQLPRARAEQPRDGGRRLLGAAERVVVPGEERGALVDHLGQAPVFKRARTRRVGSGERDAGRGGLDRAAIRGHLGVVLDERPRF